MTPSDSFASKSFNLDTASWLSDFLIKYTVQEVPADHGDHFRGPLGSITLVEIISAIEHAAQGPGGMSTIRLYQHWIASQPPDSALLYAAWFNLGTTLSDAQHWKDAILAYQKSLSLRPDFHSAAVNLGSALESIGQTEAALQAWERVLQPDVARISLLNNRGRLLELMGRFAEAKQELRRSLLTIPKQPDVIQHWVTLRQKTCEWPILTEEIPGLSKSDILRHAGTMTILALSDDIALQREAGRSWIVRKTFPVPMALSPSEGYNHDRIRLGYLSSDFCSHAMSYLIVELFERHNRDGFEVFGYCSSPDDGSDIRTRVIQSFDHFKSIKEISDEQAARLIRDDEIDILIDLNGLTSGQRLQILRWKPAPVQATYLGFVGPVPLPELDYIFCDDIVVPLELVPMYEPKPLYIAKNYQANDSKRKIGPAMTRSSAGLPDDNFVFCCFSNHYKTTEMVFTAWMEILRQSDNAIIWLLGDNEWARRHMLNRAIECRIDVERIVFASRVDPNVYMARLCLADVFLDTFPYNAGTIASDAIRMGLPLVTICGRSFASRMAASLLTAVGAPHGITTSLQKYIEFAVLLATDKSVFDAYKDLFSMDSWRRGIGNITTFTTAYEHCLRSVSKRPAIGREDHHLKLAHMIAGESA